MEGILSLFLDAAPASDQRVPCPAMQRATLFLLSLAFTTALFAAPPPLDDVLARLDAAHLKANVDKLASFGTRHTLSDTTSATRGIGAARKWIFDEMSKWAAESGGREANEQQPSLAPTEPAKHTSPPQMKGLGTHRRTNEPQHGR